jgi:hypothetical protein
MRQIIISTTFRQFLTENYGRDKICTVLLNVIGKQTYWKRFKNEDGIWTGRYDNREMNLLSYDNINYITNRTDGNISYLPANREQLLNEDGDWKREGRQDGRPSRVIKKLFSNRLLKYLSDSDFENFANLYKANFSMDGYRLELISNNKIGEVYDMDVMRGDGTLNSSCMLGDGHNMGIYENCEECEILVLFNTDNLVCGRALVWNVKSVGTKILDRIYVVKDAMYNMFIKYADDNNWLHKKDYRSYSNKTTFVNKDGECQELNLTICTDTDFDCYPYIDTFCYGSDGSINNFGDGNYEYNNTDGSRNDSECDEDDHEGQIYDGIADEYIYEDDAITITSGSSRYRHLVTHVNNTITSYDGNVYYENDTDDLVEIDGNYYECDSDSIVYNSKDEEYYLIRKCVEISGEWYPKNSEDIIEIDGTFYCKDSEDVIEIDGTFYCKDSEDVIEIDGTFYCKDSEDVIEIDGTFYLSNSDKIIFSRVDNLYILKSDAVFSPAANSFIKMCDAIFASRYNSFVPKKECVKVMGEIIYKDDIRTLDNCQVFGKNLFTNL